MKTFESMPEIFWDPAAAAVRNPHCDPGFVAPSGKRHAEPVIHRAPANPARIADDMLHRFETIDGWTDFLGHVSVLASISGSPGWEDSSSPPKPTAPGAKAIGTAQWGAAIAPAGMITTTIEKPWPVPGIDESGFIWLNWRLGDAEFSLELHASLLHQSYKWQRVLDGVPRTHESTQVSDVIEALRDFHRSAERSIQ